jgi:hypothetical protein
MAPPPGLDVRVIPTTMFLTEENVKSGTVGPGDEVFITGLFTHYAGIDKNAPIVRSGNVAMLPMGDEKIDTNLGPMDAYMIEARSIGGISGSPVFVRETIQIPIATDGGKEKIISSPGSVFLLGLIHGHWDIPPEKKNDMHYAEAIGGKVNLGIAIVVPAKKILEVINQEELMDARRDFAERKKNKTLSKMDYSEAEFQETPRGHKNRDS